MAIACWIMAAWFVVSVVLTPSSVGKVRRPLTGGVAAVTVLISLGFATTLALIATGVLR